MNNDQLKLMVLIEVGIIVVLLTALMAIAPLISGSSKGTDHNFLHDPNNMMDEVVIVEKELFIKNCAGNETFVVDESWIAIGIYVEGITRSDVSYTVMFPGYPEGAFTVNGTSFPFAEMSHEHIEETNVRGVASAIDDQPMGNWTLNYDVEEGLVKISIVKIKW